MSKTQIKKVLVANRGEIAVRIMRTCREMGIRTVAVYSDADRTMPHVLYADEAYHIGPSASAQSYLVMDRIIGTARKARADAIHPGYGFLSENASFAQAVSDSKLVFIGPSPSSIKAMGDKTEARKLVEKAGVPTVPGTPAVETVKEAFDFCKTVTLPVLIKAAAGGGGKGMRVVHRLDELESLFQSAQSEAKTAFGDGRVFIEKYLENPRHVEFQIFADALGNTIHLGERECSVQRRHQKVVEETPSPIVDADLRRRMGETAVAAAKACNYRNAGTIEFLVDRDRKFYFLEMNTRLQVEHPITELRTGLDLVALQLRVAMGDPLPMNQEDVEFMGHAIECRICAEDPHNNFLPSTGTIVHLKPPQGPGVREDRGIDVHGEISVYYDPMIAKLVAWAPTRSDAINRMTRALHEYEILGVKTNIPFCLFVMGHSAFRKGDYDTHFIPNYFTPEKLESPTHEQMEAFASVATLLHSNTRYSSPSVVPKHGSATTKNWKEQRFRNMRGADG